MVATARRHLTAGQLVDGVQLLAAAARGWDGLDDLRYPPRDLGETLGQQLLVLEAARDAARDAEGPAQARHPAVRRDA